MRVCSSGWGPSLHGDLESVWHVVDIEAPISKVKLPI